MKRIFTSSLAFALCFTAFTQGQDVVWKSIHQAKSAQPVQPTQPVVTQVVATAAPKPTPQASTLALPPVIDPIATGEPPQAIAEETSLPKPVVPGVPTPMPSVTIATSPIPPPAAPAAGVRIVSPPVTVIETPPTPIGPTVTAVPHTVEAMPTVMPAEPLPWYSWRRWTSWTGNLPECTACGDGAPALTGTIISSEVIDGNRFFIRGEALFWYTKSANGPALATTGPLSSNGIIGAPGVATVLTYNDLDERFRYGARIRGGWWFDPCLVHGIDASAFYLPSRSGSFRGSSAALTNLYRPFFVLNNNFAPTGNRPGEFSELIFTRPLVLGELSADLTSSMWGADVNYRRNLWNGCFSRIDGIAGFRYLNLNEQLTISESIQPQVPVSYGSFRLPAGSVLTVQDRFKTRNDFYGGQIGADMEWRRNKWTFDLRPVVAFGVTKQQLTINGSQTVTPTAAAPPGSFNGGLLALNSNSGRYSRDPFSIVPEITFNIGYQFNEHWKVFGGYNFLYWSNVMRPGDQIDRNIDVTRIPNFVRPNENVTPVAGNHPAALLSDTDFWAQGANVGLEYRW